MSAFIVNFNKTYQNDAAGANNKSVTSADPESVGQGHISESDISAIIKPI